MTALRTTRTTTRGRRSGLLLAALALLGAAVGAGCGSAPKATCTAYLGDPDLREDAEKVGALKASVLLIDVADNSPGASERVSSAFEQEIRTAMTTGGWLVARLSGGDTQPVTGEESCFSVTKLYQVDRNNEDAEQDEQAEGTILLADELEAQVRATAVQPRGSAVRLLREGHDVAERLLQEYGLAPAQVTVYLYSDLLGISDDCLNLDGKVAQPEIAQAVVDDCFATQQLEPLPDGVGFVTRSVDRTGTTTAQETLAGQVENLLCQEVSSTCGAE
jgi:hypothetical protein